MTVTNGKAVSLEYTVKLDNGEVVDSSVGKDPLTYTHGSHEIIRGVEAAVEGMSVGETKQVTVGPADAYGERDPKAFQEITKDKVPADAKVGTQLEGKDTSGHVVRPVVAEIKDDTVLLDFNHPLAGKTLLFDVKVVNIQ